MHAQYSVIVKKKVPYVSATLLTIIGICGVIAGLFLLLFVNTVNSSNEMGIVALLTTIPEYVKWIILFSGIGFFAFRFLYKHIAIHDSGILVFNRDMLTISTKKIIYQIPFSNIVKIEFIDPIDRHGDTKENFTILVYKFNMETTQFQLKEYNNSYALIDEFLKYETLVPRIKYVDKTFLSEDIH